MALSGSPSDTYVREFNQIYGAGGRGIITHALIQQVAEEKGMFESRWIHPLENVGSAMYEIVRNEYVNARFKDLSPDEAIDAATRTTIRVPISARVTLQECGISLQSVFRGCIQGMNELKQLPYGSLEDPSEAKWAMDEEKKVYLLPRGNNGKKITT